MYNIDTINYAISNLTNSEKEALFELVTNHASLVDKLLPGLPLLQHIKSKTPQADNDPLLEAYLAWKNKK
jgi:hypothetical protein